MARMEDFRKEDGRIDWGAYNASQVASGDRCKQCGAYILNIRLFGRQRDPSPQKCGSCRSLDDTLDDSVHHNDLVRCPHCRALSQCPGDDNYELYAEGEHTFWCDECDKQFEIITHVSYEFESPRLEAALLQED